MSNATIAVAREQLEFTEWHRDRDPRAFGATYDLGRDALRLTKIGVAIFRLMSDGKEWTIPMFAEHGVEGLQSTHSARIRTIREWLEEKELGTIHDIAPVGNRGLWRYVMVRGKPPYPARGQKGRFAKTMPKNRDQAQEFPTRGVHYGL